MAAMRLRLNPLTATTSPGGGCPHPRAPGALALSLDRERDPAGKESKLLPSWFSAGREPPSHAYRATTRYRRVMAGYIRGSRRPSDERRFAHESGPRCPTL